MKKSCNRVCVDILEELCQSAINFYWVVNDIQDNNFIKSQAYEMLICIMDLSLYKHGSKAEHKNINWQVLVKIKALLDCLKKNAMLYIYETICLINTFEEKITRLEMISSNSVSLA